MSYDLDELLPTPRLLKIPASNLEVQAHLILAAGFEDRALGFLDLLLDSKADSYGKITNASIINYLPFRDDNNSNLIRVRERLIELGINSNSIQEYIFDREHPLEFSSHIAQLMSSLHSAHHVYVDISSMSKLLILYLLNALWRKGKNFSVIYSQAKKYGPSQKEYEESLSKGHFGQDIRAEFLFTGVFEPIIPPEFAGEGPLGRSRALISFLSFNKRQSIGVASMVPHQAFIPVIGLYSLEKEKWRADALIRINDNGLLASGHRISSVPRIENKMISKEYIPQGEFQLCLSTFNYKETVKALLWLSDVYRYSHFLTIAPFGSKMQTLGAFLFTQLHSEVQIVYASPKHFHPRYSEGIKCIYEIQFIDNKQLEKRLLYKIDPDLEMLEKLASG